MSAAATGTIPAPSPPEDVAPAARALRSRVEESVARRPADCLVLSGGLDTSILAPLAAKGGTHVAVTVLASSDAPDRPYATAVAEALGWEHRVLDVTLDDLLSEVDFVVRELKTFDPMEIRNSIVIARALREAARLGVRSVMTGDGADELFGGYSFMWAKPDREFETYSRRMAETMHFSSFPLGRSLGLEVHAPYIDPRIVEFAVQLPKRLKVGNREGSPMGKWVLRWAFPEAIACWRRKDPIEVGSGSARLPALFAERISAEEFSAEQRRIREEDRIQIRDPEHLGYYRAFQRIHGTSPMGERFRAGSCAGCGFSLPRPEATFCPTCGKFPARDP
jgi:asparagine synthase (glutamine-hydrolysing)